MFLMIGTCYKINILEALSEKVELAGRLNVLVLVEWHQIKSANNFVQSAYELKTSVSTTNYCTMGEYSLIF